MSNTRSLKEARTAKALSQGALAEMVGVSQGFISDVENGRRSLSDETRNALTAVVGDFVTAYEVTAETPRNEVRRVVTRGTATVPLYRHFVRAGNGGHVLEDEAEEFDVQSHYAGTCVYVVSGDSMIEDGIESGDRLVVKLGYRFKPDGETILCRYNGDLMVKFARISDGVIWLIPANKKLHPWGCGDSDELHIIGRVIEIIKDPNPSYSSRVDLSKFKE